MAAELIYVNLGLGQMLMMGRELNDMSQVVGVMLVIIIIGVVVDRGVFARVEQRLRNQWGLVA
jgi:NitT/TauT family transport system permease protein